jgi:hypothetical protein
MKGSFGKRRGECGSVEGSPNLGGAASATLIVTPQPCLSTPRSTMRIVRQLPLQRLGFIPWRASKQWLSVARSNDYFFCSVVVPSRASRRSSRPVRRS